MLLANTIISSPINLPRPISRPRIIDFPFRPFRGPILLIFGIITIGMPWENLTSLIHNYISIKLTATRYAEHKDKYGASNHALQSVLPLGRTLK